MSSAVDIYVPTQWDTTVSNVLTSEGFDVIVKDRKRFDGTSERVYLCARGNDAISLIEVPIPDDSAHHYLLGLSQPKYHTALVSAHHALTQHGALDAQTYNQRGSNA